MRCWFAERAASTLEPADLLGDVAEVRVEHRDLREALERHEESRANWVRTDALERVEAGLAALIKELE